MLRALVSLVGLGLLLAGASHSAAESSHAADQWKLASEGGGVTIYSRPHPGSPLKEFKAVGLIDAPALVVWNVTSDHDAYTRFMPYTVECRVLKRENRSFYLYQRISPRIVRDRDYTLHVFEQTWRLNGEMAYSTHWTVANEAGPPPKTGVLRVERCDGSWIIEPESPGKTRATYTIYSDTGGSLPAWVANAASSIGVRKIFNAVRRQAKEPKYWNGIRGASKPGVERTCGKTVTAKSACPSITALGEY